MAQDTSFALDGLTLDVVVKSCPGEIQISTTNGVSPFSYYWETRNSPSDPWNVLILDGNTYDSVDVNSRTIQGAPPGDYRVTVTDADGSEFTGTVADVKIAVIELE